MKQIGDTPVKLLSQAIGDNEVKHLLQGIGGWGAAVASDQVACKPCGMNLGEFGKTG